MHVGEGGRAQHHPGLCCAVLQAFPRSSPAPACRPVLIGTSSVQESENVLNTILAHTSDRYRVQKQYIQVLNAKPDKVRTHGRGCGIAATASTKEASATMTVAN